jgi:histidinol-phosphate aminotransferase
MSICDIARSEIRALVPYDAEPPDLSFTNLNANEAPSWPYELELPGTENRYPELRPRSLQSALAELYKVDPQMVCPTRGSSEGIDLLLRTFCRAYRDNIVVLPPTFEMYSAYAQMQAAEVRTAPLLAERDFAVDWKALDEQCDENTRIVFLCSPNNPTGNLIPRSEILKFAESRSGKSVVVVDEAYIEFSGEPSLAYDIQQHDNLVILRTMSKAYALAGARCGAVLADTAVIKLLTALMSPYALSTPVTSLVLSALQSRQRASVDLQIAEIIAQRGRVLDRLEQLDSVERVWPSHANFILLRLRDSEAAAKTLETGKLTVRHFDNDSSLAKCVRITVGAAAQNEQLIDALESMEANR